MVAAILLGSMFGCNEEILEETGEPAYILDIEMIGDRVFWLGRLNSAYCLYSQSEKDSSLIKVFPEKTNVIFNKYSEKFFYLENNCVKSYTPVAGDSDLLDNIHADNLVWTFDEYILLKSDGYLLVDYKEKAMTELCDFPDGSIIVLGDYEDSIILWNETLQTVIQYNIFDNSWHTLIQFDYGTEFTMIGGAISKDNLYLEWNRGYIQKINLQQPESGACEVKINHVIALADTGFGLIAAVAEENSIAFYSLYQDEVLNSIGKWDNINYYLSGSCILRASEDKLVCALTTGKDMFIKNMS